MRWKIITLAVSIAILSTSCAKSTAETTEEQTKPKQSNSSEKNYDEATSEFHKPLETSPQDKNPKETRADTQTAQAGAGVSPQEKVVKYDSAEDAYSAILKEYEAACLVDSDDWTADPETYTALYPEVDPRVLKEYHTPCHYDDWLGDEPYAIGYVYFDIDGNGTEELILMVLCHEAMPFAVYAFDGENAVELGLVRGDRYGGYSIYANGMIAAYTGGSSTVYCRFNSDGYTVKRVSLSMDEIRGLDHYPAHEIWTGWEILADDISCHNICGHENRGMPEEEEKSSREFSAAITNTYPVFPYTSQLTVTLSDNTVAGTVFYDDGVYGEIELGDLTGDGQDEILVKVTDVGSNYGAVDIYVYTVKKSELIEILSLKSGNVGRVCPDLRYGIGAFN